MPAWQMMPNPFAHKGAVAQQGIPLRPHVGHTEPVVSQPFDLSASQSRWPVVHVVYVHLLWLQLIPFADATRWLQSRLQ